jgi:lipopolysaccharide heptosyltransferase II
MTTPSLTALRQLYPDAHITYVVETPYRDLLEDHPALNDVFILPRKPGNREFLAYIRRLRRQRYDVLIDFHGGPRAYLLSLMAKARLKIGYRIKYRRFVYDIRVPREPEQGHWHSVENHFQLVKALDETVGSIPPLSLSPAKKNEKENINKHLSQFHLQTRPFFVLHIGAGNRFRDWGENNLNLLLKNLYRVTNTPVVLIGGPEDIEKEQGLLESGPMPLYSLVAKINLREAQALIARAALFIGPDSGPMHIAATTATPIVALFGPTLPANFAPWKAKAAIVEKEFDCRPCPQRECLHQDFRCLQSISPDDIIQAIQQSIPNSPGH